MTEMVTGTPAVVGFTNGCDRGWNHGVSDKDNMTSWGIDAGERTRDVLRHIYDSIVATEKNGAANQLATEKIGAAAVLVAEKIGAANTLAVQLGFKEAAMQLAECCCEIRREVADVKATVLAVDAHRIRDDLAQCRAELLAATGGPGNARR